MKPKKSGVSPAPTRRQRALVTRQRMVEAAYRLFCERGYTATTMDAIAIEAGVAVQTVYFTFHTKSVILREAFDAAVLGHAEPTPPEETAWYRAFVAELDAARALAILVGSVSEILSRVGPLAAVLVSVGNDPDVATVYQRGEQRRHEGYGRIVAVLARKGGLRRGLSVARATDILFVLLSPELFHALSAGRGWTHAQSKRWLVDALSQQLLPVTNDHSGR